MSKYPLIAEPRRGVAVPLVAPVTPRTGGWSGDNQLGALAKYGPDNRGKQTVLKLDEWGPPEVWTLSFYVLQQLRSFNGFGIKATVNFGAGGASQTVELDWLNGTQISLPMNAVNVIASFENVDIATEGAGLQVGVQLSRGTRGGTKPPIRTMLAEKTLLSGAITDLLPIPAFARRICVAPTDMTAAERAVFYSVTTGLNLYNGNSGVGGIPIMMQGDKAEAGIISAPIIGGVRFVAVQNDGGAPLSRIKFSVYAELEG